MPAEDIELTSETSSGGRNRPKAKSAKALATIGWLIIAFGLNTIIFNAFPLKLASPEWQLNLLAGLLSSSNSLLIGATLIVLGLIFNPREKILQGWNLTVCRSASWFAVLLVLMIPLQFIIGNQAIKKQTLNTYTAINNLKAVAKRISSLNSEDELRAYVASLPNAPKLPAKFDAAFPVIKERAIENINAQVNTANETIIIQKSEATQTFLKEAIRNSAQSILMAAAFSALANISSRSKNMVTNLIGRFL